LHAVATEIDDGNAVWSRCADLVEKLTKRAAQRVLVEITRPDHVKAGGLQCLSNQAGIVRRCR